VLADQRYAKRSQGGVEHFLPEHEREEFDTVAADDLEGRLSTFWSTHTD
jgi:hypothetical protein